MGTSAPARIDVRVDRSIKKTIEEAAALSGQTTTDFVLAATIDRAKHVLRDAHEIRLNRQQADAFFALLDRPIDVNDELGQVIAAVTTKRTR